MALLISKGKPQHYLNNLNKFTSSEIEFIVPIHDINVLLSFKVYSLPHILSGSIYAHARQ